MSGSSKLGTAAVYLTCAVAAAVTWALLPHGIGSDIVEALFPTVAVVVLWSADRSQLGPGQWGWVLLGGALAALALDDLVGLLREWTSLDAPVWAPPAIRIVAPVLILGAYVYLTRVRGRVTERGALVDAGIAGIALFSIAWVAVVRGLPGSGEPTSLVALTVAGVVLYLLAAVLITAIFLSPGRRNPTIVVLIAASYTLFGGAVLDGWRVVTPAGHHPVAGSVVDGIGVALLATAALFPVARASWANARAAEIRLTSLRLGILMLVSLVPVAVLIARASRGINDGEIAVYGTSAVLVMLGAMVHTSWLLRAIRRAFTRQENLRQAAGTLAAAPGLTAIHRVAVDSALAFVEDPRARTSLSLSTPSGTVVVAAAGADTAELAGHTLPAASHELIRLAAAGGSVEVRASQYPEAGLRSGDDPLTLFPLVVGGETMGVLGVRTTRSLPRDERQALETLSAQVALALDGTLQAEAAANTRVERRFQALVRHASDLVTLVDERMMVRYQSPSIETALGWSVDEVTGMRPLVLVHPQDRSRVILFWRQVRERPGVHPAVDFRLRTKDGGWRSFETIANNLLDDDEVRGIVLTSRDITDRRNLETRLVHQAFHDELTGLANRALFNDRVGHSLAVAARESRSVAVLFLDLDDFKEVNDSLGHQAGDAVLIETGRRIELCLRQGDTAARLSGDEFGILLERATRETATGVAERVLEQLRLPFLLAGKELSLRASVGIALSATDGDSAEELLRNADTAMYRAKSSGKSAFALFKPSMHAAALERLELRNQLEGAAARGEMSLRYQPIFDLSTGAIAGFEALLRWVNPRHGSILPSTFIPLAEETGTIVPLGAWAFETAVEQFAAWDRRWPDEARGLWLSVNLSTRQLADPSLPALISRVVEASGIAPGRLLLEVTESVLVVDADEATRQLATLRALGLKVAIDDFGTGYSSLSVLEQMPVDLLKIASRFVERLGSDEQRPRLVEAMVRLGDTLSLPTVAEGIETLTQLTVLQLLGCELGQGFYLSRPLRADRVEGLLARAAAGDPLIIGATR